MTVSAASPRRELTERRLLVHGLGVTNAAVARAAVHHGLEVVLSDDREPAGASSLAAELDAELVLGPTPEQLESLVAVVDANDRGPTLNRAIGRFRVANALASTNPVLRQPGFGAADYRRLTWILREEGSGTRSEFEAHLAAVGCDTASAHDGAAGLAAMAQRRFDAVLMDSSMPVLDGASTIELMRLLPAGVASRRLATASTLSRLSTAS